MTITNTAGGELYFIRERDVLTGELSPYVKIGLVRENESKTSVDRAREHQTGNPRELYVHHVVTSACISYLESTMHGRFEPSRVSGEWFNLSAEECQRAVDEATAYAARLDETRTLLDDAAVLKKTVSTDELVELAEEDRPLVDSYVRADRSTKVIVAARKSLKSALATWSDQGIDISKLGTITMTERRNFDQERFALEFPDLAAEFTTTKTDVGGTLRFAAGLGGDLALEEFNPGLAELVDALGASIADFDGRDASPIMEKVFALSSFEAAAEFDKDLATAALQDRCGSASGIAGVCTWKRSEKATTKIDNAAVKRAHPDLYERFALRSLVPTIAIANKNRDQEAATMDVDDEE